MVKVKNCFVCNSFAIIVGFSYRLTYIGKNLKTINITKKLEFFKKFYKVSGNFDNFSDI